MKKIAWISHYPSEADIFRMNNFKWKNKIARKIFVNMNRRRTAYIFTNFINYGRGVEYFGLICPLTPYELILLNKKTQLNVIRNALLMANELKIDQIGLASLFASIWEDPKDLTNFTQIPITTGKNFIGSLVFEYITKACDLLEKNIKNCTIGLIGCKSSLLKVFLQYYGDRAEAILIDEEDSESKKCAIAKAGSLEKIFRTSDIVITNTMGFGLEKYINSIKAGSIVCDLMVPFYLTHEISKTRKDVLSFEGVWTRYRELSNYKDKKGQINNLLRNEIVPACVAEPLTLILEKIPSYFSTVGNINYANMVSMSKARSKHGFNFFGFKQGDYIYSDKDIDKIKNVIGK